MEDYLKANPEDSGDSSDGDGESMVHVGDGFYLFRELYNQIYEHQREGVLFLWRLFKRKKGGVLGDDMGQVDVFLFYNEP
jgi:SNF2 family DNA or RNA helicase